MSEKVERLLARLGNIWPKKVADETLGDWLADWEGTLRPFEPWEIDAAATRMIQTRTKAGFPFPGEVAEVCRQVRADDRASKPRLGVAKVVSDPYKLADDLIQCELGRQAASADPCWILALHDFCRENQRLPSGLEIERCKRIAADFEIKYRLCIAGKGGDFSRPLTKLAETMIRRRETLRERLIGRAA